MERERERERVGKKIFLFINFETVLRDTIAARAVLHFVKMELERISPSFDELKSL